ncbi:MAG: ABC transporter permease [Candidatus Velthaea sp.]
MTALLVARMQWRELARRRLALVAALLTATVALLTAWGLNALVHHPVRGELPPEPMVRAASAVIVILLAFFFTIVLATGGALIASPALAGEIESGVALAILARPIRRADVVLGKWLGTLVAIAAYALAAGGLELAVIRAVTGYVPPHPLAALAYLVGVAAVICTAALALSARLPSLAAGVVAVLLYGVAWIGGILGALGAAFGNERLADIATIVALVFPSDALWRGAVFALEPAVFAAASNTSVAGSFNPFGVGAPPTPAMLLWSVGWLAAVFAAAVASYRVRDL